MSPDHLIANKELLERRILAVFTDFYRLEPMSSNEKKYHKKHAIAILATIIEQFFRSIVESQLKDYPQKLPKSTNVRLPATDDAVDALSNGSERAPKELIDSFHTFQSTDNIKTAMNKFGISTFNDKLKVREFDKIFKLRHVHAHAINRSLPLEEKYYILTEKLLEHVLSQITHVCFSFYDLKGRALQNLARSHEEVAECLRKSVCYFDNLIKNEPNALAYCGKGRSLNRLGKYQEAIVCLDRAIELDPNNACAHGGKGASLRSLKKYQEAIVCLDRAIELGSE